MRSASARGDVGQAAGREADQQAHGAGGEIGLGLGKRQARQQRQRGKRAQGVAAGERHKALSRQARTTSARQAAARAMR
ncbi:hypothetical protein O9557_20065 [Achromobacter ruhlandii]|nr:hypothetical protein [Achromobacter ruhlandii]MCZ8398203.1 hypothetical protein [Achromobacter ruhlandii]